VNVLELRGVTKRFARRRAGAGDTGPALDRVSLELPERPFVTAIAGESGSGKTTMARLLLGMIEPTEGEVRYRGTALERLDREARRHYRRNVQAVFQDPFEVYNPFYRVDHVLTTPLRRFGIARSPDDVRERIEEALRTVGLRPEETLGRYPHQLSGGQRQRVMIARAILLKPKVLIADEPVSMVDASLRASILGHLIEAHRTFDISIVYITHDLTTAYQVCEDIVIMYQGAIVERGPVEPVILRPAHPYTQLLVGSIPLPDPTRKWGEGLVGPAAVRAADAEAPPEAEAGQRRSPSPSEAPRAARPQRACSFAPRCPHAMDVCLTAPPELLPVDDGRSAACYLYDAERSERARGGGVAAGGD
jgi:ABC-type oligopeptide transport system ATPase subunit